MDPNPTLHRVVKAVRRWKQESVDRYGIGTDLPQTLITLQGTTLVTAIDLTRVGDSYTVGATVLAGVSLSDADFAAVIWESYVADADRYSSADDLRRHFAAGAPDVHEAVVITAMNRARQWSVTEHIYRYVGKHLEWNNPHDVDDDEEMGAVEALGRGFIAQERRRGPAVLTPGTLLQLVDQTEAEDDLVFAFAVTTSCPCGSRQPLEHCCGARN